MPEQGINMRVTANSNQGHRKYMEDCYKIRFHRENQDNEESNILFSYFAIFDGHGGKEAAHFAKENLYWKIIECEDFWSDDENKVLKAIHDGFVKCHMEMWKELPKWPKTAAGLPSTSGCTATVLFIKKSKAFVGHVGDSGLAIGFGDSYHTQWSARKLTRDHKPEDPIEMKRIENSGGEVVSKGGVNRVVWNRPITSHQGPVRRSTHIEKIPFLAVARSLGDLWSYNYNNDEFIVSPVPDVFSFEIDPNVHRCIVLATDGLWNILKSNEVVEIVRQTDRETENLIIKAQNKSDIQPFVNPSQRLVNLTVQRCCEKILRADNTTCITIMLDKPGISFSDNVLQKQSQTMNDSQEINELMTPNATSMFNTPSFRSKSLISLRRRHWSASTNNSEQRSTKQKTKSVKSLHLDQNSTNKLILKKKLFNNSYSFSHVNHKKHYNHDDNSENMVKLAKNIKEIYDNDQIETAATNTTGRTPTNSYKRRLRLIKNRLMKTKNSLFKKKRKIFNISHNSAQKKVVLNSKNGNNNKNNIKPSLNPNNQSFVDNFRNKLNTLKRGNSYKNNDQTDNRQAKKIKIN